MKIKIKFDNKKVITTKTKYKMILLDLSKSFDGRTDETHFGTLIDSLWNKLTSMDSSGTVRVYILGQKRFNKNITVDSNISFDSGYLRSVRKDVFAAALMRVFQEIEYTREKILPLATE